mmetsp:Transcript_16673/g.47860  ORF Transcript_16673/g.47860 Transcript_16673/m.47860 type:complete len:210 (+) Transcript_16673:86-715(+)
MTLQYLRFVLQVTFAKHQNNLSQFRFISFLPSPAISNSSLCLLGGRLFVTNGIMPFKGGIIGSVMDSSGTSRGIGSLLKGLIPLHGTLRRTGNTLSAGHCLNRRIAGEQLLKDHAIPVSLLRGGGVVRESVGSRCEHLIGNLLIGLISQIIDPAISDTITELLLLPPKDLIGKVRIVGSIERLPDGPLLNASVLLGNARSLLDHLLLRL